MIVKSTVSITGAQTLYAQWKINTIHVYGAYLYADNYNNCKTNGYNRGAYSHVNTNTRSTTYSLKIVANSASSNVEEDASQYARVYLYLYDKDGTRIATYELFPNETKTYTLTVDSGARFEIECQMNAYAVIYISTN